VPASASVAATRKLIIRPTETASGETSTAVNVGQTLTLPVTLNDATL
jgi:hypothetical protein